MAQAMVNFRMDAELKKNMEETCKEMGLTLTSAFTMFAAKVTREKRIPFDVEVDPFYNPENIAEIERRIADMKAGHNMSEHELIEED